MPINPIRPDRSPPWPESCHASTAIAWRPARGPLLLARRAPAPAPRAAAKKPRRPIRSCRSAATRHWLRPSLRDRRCARGRARSPIARAGAEDARSGIRSTSTGECRRCTGSPVGRVRSRRCAWGSCPEHLINRDRLRRACPSAERSRRKQAAVHQRVTTNLPPSAAR